MGCPYVGTTSVVQKKKKKRNEMMINDIDVLLVISFLRFFSLIIFFLILEFNTYSQKTNRWYSSTRTCRLFVWIAWVVTQTMTMETFFYLNTY